MRKVEVPKVFVDEISARILMVALPKPRSAREIQRASGVPVAEVYSRLLLLERKGLVREVKKVIDLSGKEIPLYQAQLHNAYIFTENSKLKARFQLVACGQAEMAYDAKAFI